MWLFAKKKTPTEMLRENKRMLDKSIRELDRERMHMQSQEKKLIAEIKKMAKQNQMGAVKVMAKDLVRTRHSITKFYSLKSQLQGVSLRMQTLKSSQAMADAMRGVTKAMKSMNTRLSLPSLQNILKEFERQNEKMDMTTEVMGDAIDDAFAEEDEEEETEELVNAVLDELGCNVGAEMVSAPAGGVGVAVEKDSAGPTPVLEGTAAESGDGGLDDDLQARLDKLRGA